ncbi:hypothetical protein GGR56DRAFT_109910 [Xylariaceae sp. FL0804]|nr:hypothetical protein GGR56DRAFT_109910 [Xylariaceae sp. FL0804]
MPALALAPAATYIRPAATAAAALSRLVCENTTAASSGAKGPHHHQQQPRRQQPQQQQQQQQDATAAAAAATATATAAAAPPPKSLSLKALGLSLGVVLLVAIVGFALSHNRSPCGPESVCCHCAWWAQRRERVPDPERPEGGRRKKKKKERGERDGPLWEVGQLVAEEPEQPWTIRYWDRGVRLAKKLRARTVRLARLLSTRAASG